MDDKTRELLEVLATKLGAKAQELGEHVVNYTYMCGLMAVIAGGILLFLTVLLWGFSFIAFKSEEIPTSVTLGLCGVLPGMIGMMLLFAGLPTILEPIGATIKGLL